MPGSVPPELAPVLDAFARGELADAAVCFAEGAVYREAQREPIRGRPAIADHFARFATHASGWRFSLDEVIAQGRLACVIYRFAVAGGQAQPVRERAGCATVRLDDSGLIAEWREYEG